MSKKSRGTVGAIGQKPLMKRHSGKGYGYGHKRMDSVCSCLGKLENGMQ